MFENLIEGCEWCEGLDDPCTWDGPGWSYPSYWKNPKCGYADPDYDAPEVYMSDTNDDEQTQLWPWKPPNVGCVACACRRQHTGEVTACRSQLGYDGADKECPQYSDWVKRHDSDGTPPHVKWLHEYQKFTLKDVRYKSIGATNTDAHTREHHTGIKMGLKFKVDLATKCADYYVLERIVNDTFEREFYTIQGSLNQRSRLSSVPKHHTSDMRSEMLAYSAYRWRDDTNEFLAKQLSRYLILACGGELRHAVCRLSLQVGQHTITPFECVHRHSDECCIEPAPTRPRPPHLHSDYCCSHKHTSECAYHFSPRMHKYLYQAATNGTMQRHQSWSFWWKLVKRNPTIWMRECASIFNDLQWSAGYGGKPWGFAASLCVDYLSGNISAETFIDRCWTLQHHGGHIFNKFWIIESLATATGYTSDEYRIDYVLNVQASGNYDELAKFCSPDIGRMWVTHARMTAHEAYTQSYSERLVQRVIDSRQ
jgi:hypothetical protein